MGWNEAIGKKIELGNAIKGRVIGVMKDYHQTGMYNEVETFVLVYRTISPFAYVKLSGKNNEATLAFIETKWKEIFPDQPFNYTYLTERFNRQFEADEKRGLIFTIFTVLAILIACLGLFGLASYTVEHRTKEIGIRKVFGASEGTILRLISREFLVLILIGIAIAVPAAFLIMSKWLENYVYRTDISIMVLVYASLLTFVVTFLTISYKAYQASVLNPARSIKQ
jgi:putative ABC transport system permease protein